MLLYLFQFAKVRAVRMANRETSYSLLLMLTKYICSEKELRSSSCSWLGALSAYVKREQ
jgi:hypothetical protein